MKCPPRRLRKYEFSFTPDLKEVGPVWKCIACGHLLPESAIAVVEAQIGGAA